MDSEDVTLRNDTAEKVREKVHDTVGIVLDRPQYKTRLRNAIRERMKEIGIGDGTEYLEHLRGQSVEEELRNLTDRILVNETLFYRNRPQMKALQDEVLPKLLGVTSGTTDTSIRVLSAGCSDGAEPYSLLIALREVANQGFDRDSNPDCQVFGMDVSESAIRKARRGKYSRRSVQNAPSRVVSDYFNEVESGFRIRDELKEDVRFLRRNLKSDPVPQELDLILVRNVLIYFQEEDRRRILRRLLSRLKPDGYLVSGHSEDFSLYDELLEPSPFGHGIYEASDDRQPESSTDSRPSLVNDKTRSETTEAFEITVSSTREGYQDVKIQGDASGISETVLRGRVRNALVSYTTPVNMKIKHYEGTSVDCIRKIVKAVDSVLREDASIDSVESNSSVKKLVEETLEDLSESRSRELSAETDGTARTGELDSDDDFSVSLVSRSKSIIVQLTGRLESSKEDALKRKLKEHFDDLVAREKIIFQFENVEYVDRSFVNILSRLGRMILDGEDSIRLNATDSGVRDRLSRWGYSDQLVKDPGGVHDE